MFRFLFWFCLNAYTKPDWTASMTKRFYIPVYKSSSRQMWMSNKEQRCYIETLEWSFDSLYSFKVLNITRAAGETWLLHFHGCRKLASRFSVLKTRADNTEKCIHRHCKVGLWPEKLFNLILPCGSMILVSERTLLLFGFTPFCIIFVIAFGGTVVDGFFTALVRVLLFIPLRKGSIMASV